MSEIWPIVQNVSMTCLSGAVVGYVITKVTMRNMKKYVAEQKVELKEMAEKWLNSETGQKALLQIGALIGNGAKTGIGFGGTTRGRGGLTGIIAEIAGQFIKSKIPQQEPQQQGEQHAPW